MKFGRAKFRRASFNAPISFDFAVFNENADFASAVFVKSSFTAATFAGSASFTRATFTDDTQFNAATFAGEANFTLTTFAGNSGFTSALFNQIAIFNATNFTGELDFSSASFSSKARFASAVFTNKVRFSHAAFEGEADFHAALFSGGAFFNSTNFDNQSNFSDVTFASTAEFISTSFHKARFLRASFEASATLTNTKFSDDARFDDATFWGYTRFDSAHFTGTANFSASKFLSQTYFTSAHFVGEAGFSSTSFSGNAHFSYVEFTSNAHFGSAVFTGHATFTAAKFRRSRRFGPLVCAQEVVLTGAEFFSPITIEIVSKRLTCRHTRWSSRATLRLRYSAVDFTDAVLEGPVSVATAPHKFTTPSGVPLLESQLAGSGESVQIESISGTDAANLVLTDVDLSICRFAGAVHLDRLHLEGQCDFSTVPSGIRWAGWRPVRWTPRRTLAEEQYWRESRPWHAGGWSPSPSPPSEVNHIGPAALSAVYRQLRKSLEDSKNEPDAADFYYGEMEMRRKDTRRPTAERGILAAYWALSGYGLRGARAIYWFLASALTTLVAMMLWGLPVSAPEPVTKGTLTDHQIELTTSPPTVINPSGPLSNRMSSRRFDKSLRVVINSVVFRSSGQILTTTGTYSEMASRVAEPVLLGLAILAVRSRIKR